MLLNCNLCKQADKEFLVPGGDGIGEAIMREHLNKIHSIQIFAPERAQRNNVDSNGT